MVWRRLFQFRLQTLFVLCAALCAALALWILPARRERSAAAALEARGVSVYYPDELYSDGRPWPVAPKPPRWHQRWTGCDLLGSPRVILFDDHSTDEDFAHLRGLSHVHRVNAGYSGVTDDGLKHIAQLRHLQSLNLSGTAVTDRGLVELAPLAELQLLNLDRTKVTATGVRRLSVLKKLKYLSLRDIEWTRADIAELERALPECNIDWGAP
jgi:hypothetical protein